MRRPHLLDTGVLVVIWLALAVNGIVAFFDDHPLSAFLAVLVSAAGVLLCHRLPLPGLAVVAAAPLMAVAGGADPTGVWTIAVLTTLLLTLRGSPAVLAGTLAGAANFAAVAIEGQATGLGDPVAWVAAFNAAAAAVAGSAIRGQRQYWTALQGRTHEAVAGRDAAVQRSVAEERLRIARDLHDTLGHEIAVMSMHLGAVEVQLPDMPTTARQHLAAVRGSVRSLLAETQEILAVLHTSGDGETTGPVASHHDVPDLVERFRTAGMDVDAQVGDLTADLPAQTSAAVYRITQEGLTNAQRHGSGRVSLSVQVTGAEATVEVVNHVPQDVHDSDRIGQGLIGMRERASAAGGHLDVIAGHDTFRVHAVLPVTTGALR
jgi:signal transduction histidine kinase